MLTLNALRKRLMVQSSAIKLLTQENIKSIHHAVMVCFQCNVSAGSIKYGNLKLYRGKDTMKQFLNIVLELAENHHKSMKQPLQTGKNDWSTFFRTKLCHICNQLLGEDRVRDHCHLTGKFRGASALQVQRCSKTEQRRDSCYSQSEAIRWSYYYE